MLQTQLDLDNNLNFTLTVSLDSFTYKACWSSISNHLMRVMCGTNRLIINLRCDLKRYDLKWTNKRRAL